MTARCLLKLLVYQFRRPILDEMQSTLVYMESTVCNCFGSTDRTATIYPCICWYYHQSMKLTKRIPHIVCCGVEHKALDEVTYKPMSMSLHVSLTHSIDFPA